MDNLVVQRAGGEGPLLEFVDLLRRFAVETRFDAFYQEQCPFYDEMVRQYQAIVSDFHYVEDLEAYYGTAQNSYTIILAPLYHPGGIGVRIDQANPGAGAAFVTVAARTPGSLDNQDLGNGCGTPNLPILHATGSPAKATLGNASFGLTLSNVAPLSACAMLISSTAGPFPLGGGCTLYMDPLQIALTLSGSATANGTHHLPLPIPVNLSLEGQTIVFQGVELQPGTGAHLGQVDFSNGLWVRIGNTPSGCP